MKRYTSGFVQIRTARAASISIVVISLNIVLVLLEHLTFQEELVFTISLKRLMASVLET